MENIMIVLLIFVLINQIRGARFSAQTKKELGVVVGVLDALQTAYIVNNTVEEDDGANLCDCVDFEHGVGGHGECQKCYGSGWVEK